MRGLISLGAFLLLLIAGSAIYHYDLTAATEIVMLVVTTLMTGLGVVSIIGRDRFSRAEATVIATAIGFAITAFLQWLTVLVGWPDYIAILIAIAIAIATLVSTRSWSWANCQLATFAFALPFATLLVLFFNLACMRYGADGSIVSHGLFGHDMPFLAGEIHGLRYGPHLLDLHQSALRWSYHDATYHVLALTAQRNTLDVLVWGMPVFGYTILAVGVYGFVDRWLKNRVAAIGAVVLWFLSSPYWGSELTSYALSPSFILGSIVLLAILITAREYLRSRRTRLALLLMLLVIELSAFKISTFLVLGPALGLLALILIRRDRKSAIVFGAAALAALVSLALAMDSSPFMPAGDFVVGAPLLGYANHLAAVLHQPLSRINPVTKGGLAFRSLLLIPYLIFHVARLIVLDPRVLVGMVMGYLVVRHTQKLSPEGITIALLLLIAIPIGYMLPVLYSPAWYPLALSFYAPLVSAQAAVLLMAIGFDRWFCARSWLVKIGVPLVAIISVGLGVRSAYRAVIAKPFVVSSELRSVLTDLSEAPRDHAILATRRFDLDPTDIQNDESFYWYAGLSGHPVVSEGAKYGSLLSAVADVDSAKGLHPVPAAQQALASLRGDLNTIYYSGDTAVVFTDIRQHHIGYVLERLAAGTPDERLHVDLSPIARVLYQQGNTRLWQVR